MRTGSEPTLDDVPAAGPLPGEYLAGTSPVKLSVTNVTRRIQFHPLYPGRSSKVKPLHSRAYSANPTDNISL